MSFQSFTDSFGVSSYFNNFTNVQSKDASYLTYKDITMEDGIMDTLYSVFWTLINKPWIGSIIGSFLVSLSGVFPLLLIHFDDENSSKQGVGSQSLKVLLSFAVGGLLGDVFLHLLPEAWTLQAQIGNGNPSMFCGVWVLIGLLLFIIVEKLFSGPNPYEVAESEEMTEEVPATPLVTQDKALSMTKEHTPLVTHNNNLDDDIKNCKLGDDPLSAIRSSHQQVAGYLNLMANSIDNFTHGLAVGGSFLLSPRVGALTTFAILVHEVPHEIGDFAILMRAGFSRWDAAKAQLLTGMAGLVGAMTAVTFSGAGTSMEAKTSWILPFTAGGFLHISLVTVLPELLQEQNPWESLKQMVSLVTGIALMAFLTAFCES